MSDTPRTDYAADVGHYVSSEVGAEFARELERELNAASARIEWLSEHPESIPYLEDGLWRIPYLMDGAGGFGGGVGEVTHRTLIGVIDAAMERGKC
jgi:hypothetical protein